MNIRVILGIVLMAVGLFLVLPRREVHHVEIGPLQANVEETKEERDPMVVVVGTIAIIAGAYIIIRRG